MESAILDLIETELICVKDERARLKDKKTNLERIRAALRSKGASSGTTIVSTVKKEGKRKHEKDPNKPKRPQSAYNIFYQDKAQVYKEQHPHVPQKDIMSIVGPTWKECTPEEKAVYEVKAAALKAEFDIKLRAYHNDKSGLVAVAENEYQEDEDDDDSEDEENKKKMKKM
jgi:hypothetical protein